MERLLAAALEARDRARAPFSGFLVGAAVEDEEGRCYGGCNVESDTYGLTICAERAAVFRAIAEGAGNIRRLLVVADTEELTPPCGACRQVIAEQCPHAEIILCNLQGRRESMTLHDLLPRPFSRRLFQKND